jgi:hypothetical protein
LKNALFQLYPGSTVMTFQYLDESFCAFRETVLNRRATDQYKALEEKIQMIRLRPATA